MDNSNISSLKTLQVIIDRLKTCEGLNLANATFVCVQHLLFTTVDLVKSLVILGAKPSNIHIMGKIYSICPKVVEQIIKIGAMYYPSSQPHQLGCFDDYFNKDIINMWDNVSATITNTKSNTIIVLDDGSKCIANTPKSLSNNYLISTVEQTSSGIVGMKKSSVTFPIIDVAFSTAKQLLEPLMIARAVVAKLDKALPLHEKHFIYGVVGLGVIGKAIVQKLLSFNCRVIIYDRLEEKYNLMNSVEVANDIQSLFQKADYIFGCTGEDITTSLDLDKMHGIKHLISCSSCDIEFQSLLKIIQNSFPNHANVLDDINFSINNTVIKILRGGYPINLDNSGESVPAKDIQLTRGLLLGGVIQAILQLSQEPNQRPTHCMLHPKIQRLVVQSWANDQINSSFNETLIANFLDEEWIKNNSSGEYVDNDLLSKVLKVKDDR